MVLNTGHEISGEERNTIVEEALVFAEIGLYRYLFDGTVLFMDRGAMRILGLDGLYADPREMAGRNIEDLFQYVGPRGFLRQHVREQGRVRDLEYPFKTLGGIRKWALHDSFLVTDPASGAEAIQVIIRDITRWKETDLALVEARSEAQFYLDLMVHDITNFHQVLLGNLGLLEKGVTPDARQQKLFDACRRQLAKAGKLIAMVKSFTLIKGKEPLPLQPVDLNAILASCVETARVLHPEDAGRIRFQSGGETWVLAADLLDSVFLNLIDNAMVHGASCGASVTVSVAETPEVPGFLRVDVSDEGPGVPDEVKQQVFVRLVRLSKEKGSGLGLHLVKAIVERAGGSVCILDRVPGDYRQGSIFRVWLRKEQADGGPDLRGR